MVLIAFKRPKHTALVLEAIRQYKPSRLYLIADGPRAGIDVELAQCLETRRILENVDWDCEVIRDFSDVNLGLKERVTSGLDLVFSREDQAIILEDDCLPNQDFFRFCEFALEKHVSDLAVALVSGNNFNPVAGESGEYFFTNHANIWGWATWSRTWQGFKESGYLNGISDVRKAVIVEQIKVNGAKKRFSKLLNALDTLDSWAVPFASFVYSKGLLCATPGANLVTNVGMGADSTHTKFESYVDEVPWGQLAWPISGPSIQGPDLKKMKREARHRAFKWVTYPLKHPVDFTNRFLRYLRVR